MDGKALRALYHNGTAKRGIVNLNRADGTPNPRKRDWQEVWHIKGVVPNTRTKYDFTVVRHANTWSVYDFSMQ